MSPQLIEDFVHYASDKDVAPLSEIRDALQKPNDRTYIERALKAEIIAAKYGFDASYPFRLQGDTQIERAIELFPEAQKLALKAADVRLHGPAAGSEVPGTRAAQAVPHSR